jgi:hypothetical protein
MLRISKIKEKINLNNDTLVHYPFELKIGNRRINLNKTWSEIKINQFPNRLETNQRIFPKQISQNFFYYLTLHKIFQDRCLKFSKFLVNSDVYNKTKTYSNQDISFGNIIKFYQLQGNVPSFVHASVSLGNGLFISKLGYMGIYIQDLPDLLSFYETDDKYIKVCSPVRLFDYTNDSFKPNLNLLNTFDENEQ